MTGDFGRETFLRAPMIALPFSLESAYSFSRRVNPIPLLDITCTQFNADDVHVPHDDARKLHQL